MVRELSFEDTWEHILQAQRSLGLTVANSDRRLYGLLLGRRGRELSPPARHGVDYHTATPHDEGVSSVASGGDGEILADSGVSGNMDGVTADGLRTQGLHRGYK